MVTIITITSHQNKQNERIKSGNDDNGKYKTYVTVYATENAGDSRSRELAGVQEEGV